MPPTAAMQAFGLRGQYERIAQAALPPPRKAGHFKIAIAILK